MMAMTTSNSTNVKPRRGREKPCAFERIFQWAGASSVAIRPLAATTRITTTGSNVLVRVAPNSSIVLEFGAAERIGIAVDQAGVDLLPATTNNDAIPRPARTIAV